MADEVRDVGGELVVAEETAARHACRREHVFSDVLLVRLTAHALNNLAQDDVAAVAIFFLRARCEHRRLRGDELIIGVVVDESALGRIAEGGAEDIGNAAVVRDQLLNGRGARGRIRVVGNHIGDRRVRR